MLFGCSEDLFDEQINNSKFKVNYVDSKGLKKNVELLKSLKKERLIDSNISGRIINDPINNFSIDTDLKCRMHQNHNFTFEGCSTVVVAHDPRTVHSNPL